MEEQSSGPVGIPVAHMENLDVSFEDIAYEVRTDLFKRERKALVCGASGAFRAGELSVIVGQSGAGKSTLLNILAGYTVATSGRLRVNGRERDDRSFRQRACYIMQNDLLQPLLSVQEALAVAAELKLGSHVERVQKRRRVEELMTALGLSNSRDTWTGALSGGQRKRLAIGLELVSDPPVMFLDEPISGLDSSTSKQLVSLLRLLARQGRTLVITMHQPSTPLLLMVDRLYALVAGRCAYVGAVPNLVTYLNSLGLHCPPYHNPVDFLIEVCSGSEGPDRANKLVDACGNGKLDTWMVPETQPTTSNIVTISEMPYNFGDLQLTALPIKQHKDPQKFGMSRRYPTSLWKQFSTLFTRSLKMIWRDPSLTGTRLLIHCSMALFVGTLYFNIGNDAKYLNDNYRFLFYSLMFLMFTAFTGVTLSFPTELPVVRREHFNRWYSTGAYFASSIAAMFPIQTACSVLYAIITYWMTGQPPDFVRFFLFTFMLTFQSLIAMFIGLLNGSIFDVKHGVTFGCMFVMPFTIFSGFFLSYADAPAHFRWLYHVSFLKHGYVGLCIAIFGYGRPRMECSKDFCEIIHPYKFLEYLKIDHELYSTAVLALYAIVFVVITTSYTILRFRLKRKM